MDKILCIGTSLCLPRDEVRYEDTWYYLLKNKHRNCDFIDYFKRAQVISETDFLYDNYYRFYCPDYVIWEMGINDSAPRYIVEQKLFWKMVLRLISNTWIEKPFWKIIKTVRKRNPERVATHLPQFEGYAEKLIKDFIALGVKKVLILKIESIGSHPRSRNPYWIDNIGKYNEVYDKLATRYPDNVVVLNPFENAEDDWYLDDGYHPNKKGMQMAFNQIDEILSECMTPVK